MTEMQSSGSLPRDWTGSRIPLHVPLLLIFHPLHDGEEAQIMTTGDEVHRGQSQSSWWSHLNRLSSSWCLIEQPLDWDFYLHKHVFCFTYDSFINSQIPENPITTGICHSHSSPVTNMIRYFVIFLAIPSSSGLALRTPWLAWLYLLMCERSHNGNARLLPLSRTFMTSAKLHEFLLTPSPLSMFQS